MAKTPLKVTWEGNPSPLNHPRFQGKVTKEGDKYIFPYPFWKKQGFLQGKKAQREWADDVIRHLNSWKIQGKIEE